MEALGRGLGLRHAVKHFVGTLHQSSAAVHAVPGPKGCAGMQRCPCRACLVSSVSQRAKQGTRGTRDKGKRGIKGIKGDHKGVKQEPRSLEAPRLPLRAAGVMICPPVGPPASAAGAWAVTFAFEKELKVVGAPV